MKRRDYLKSILILGGLSATSFSFYKWFDLNRPVDPKQLLSKRTIIAELAEMIIPATDTPGAMAAGVHDYILNVMINCNDVRQQNKFFSGIENLEDYTISQYGKDFLKCDVKERHNVLQHFSENSGYSYQILNKINNKFLGEPFYSKLKNLTIEGYCLSKPGATEALAYDYIPGTYQACIPLKLNQKSWATK